ncbi:carbamoylphosphate synthase large subunit [Coprinopsis marcescibilis]|uniref:Carbamoylphosphate synthase large subunit n=1 Tax=Coprinopsis marcescibilis TaxID=230819 RepID=A0A5C3KPK9_COPMA|nr:carbamoylphosphate synthase large subunit [Coprinopsis marcescibilis]
MPKRQPTSQRKLNVLLSNGRFPVTLDLARQLRTAGHKVFVADCMHYHVCKFSNVVTRSFHTPSPREDAEGYVAGIVDAIRNANIDIVIPMHEEILYLAEVAQSNDLLRSRLLAPPFQTLVMLHNKWEFSRFLTQNGLGVPNTVLCRNYEDVQALDKSIEWALKPGYGRASMSVFHLRPGKPLPAPDEIGISEDVHYVAQEWTPGQRYCTYSVLQSGKVTALGAYPVKDTIDVHMLVTPALFLGSSCVYFEVIEKPEIRAFVDRLAAHLPGVSGQFALDLVERQDGVFVAIECNPRATSGIHLFSGTSRLALALTCRLPSDNLPVDDMPDHVGPPKRAKRKVAPGMLMWKRSNEDGSTKAIVKEYMGHMKRLVASRDVIWSWRDLMPSIMQPFLLTSYDEIYREKGLELPTMFQYDLVWEPRIEHLRECNAVEGNTIETFRAM